MKTLPLRPMKILTARLKDVPTCSVELSLHFGNSEWLLASSVIETEKRRMLEQLKSEMHSKIAVLSLDDIEFKITD